MEIDGLGKKFGVATTANKNAVIGLEWLPWLEMDAPGGSCAVRGGRVIGSLTLIENFSDAERTDEIPAVFASEARPVAA